MFSLWLQYVLFTVTIFSIRVYNPNRQSSPAMTDLLLERPLQWDMSPLPPQSTSLLLQLPWRIHRVVAAWMSGWRWWHGSRDLLLVVVSGTAHSDLLLGSKTSPRWWWCHRNPWSPRHDGGGHRCFSGHHVNTTTSQSAPRGGPGVVLVTPTGSLHSTARRWWGVGRER
jgi:hypothetical protein